MRVRFSLSVLLVVLSVAIFAVQPAPAQEGEKGGRYVFAHYMTAYFSPVEFYKHEIRLAQRHGIDGFVMNCGAWLEDAKYIQATERMYEAARQLDSGFKLMLSGDWAGREPHDMYDQIKRFYDHPNQFKQEGASVISCFSGSPNMWDKGHQGKGMEKLIEEGYEVFEVPDLMHPRWSANRSMEVALRYFEQDPSLDGLFWFGPDAPVSEILRINATLRRATLAEDKIYMAGVSPCYNSPNLRGHFGIEGYGRQWEGLIRDGADWVEIVTWNDYNEDSNLMPYRWQSGWEKQYYDHDEAYLDATGYYSAWFKSGRRPEIPQDRLYYAYRNRSMWLRRAWDFKEEKWVDLTLTDWPFDQMHDDTRDLICVTTVLTAPAELSVRIGGQVHRYSQPAGVASARVPLAGGVPQFTLTREGEELLDFAGRKRILTRETQTKRNSARGYHLLNRTWTGGGAVGEVAAHLEVEDGELYGGSKLVSVGDARTVQNIEDFGSGYRVEVGGLETATYTVRVRYSNPSGREVRLTLMADNPHHEAGDLYPYYAPLPFPPTGKGEFRTISFLWSMYEETDWMKVELMENGENVQRGNLLTDDYGTPLVDWIELVKVEPFPVPEPRDPVFPEMVHVPGGSFTMGDAKGRPDERPAHEVTVSPFAMSKHEITNELYEKFDPDHRQHRDGYSWRDREPVIYVSWIDGARYCNWLSEQAGLTPAYRQEGEKKRWVVDTEADGFRMPTEAEWEYAAGGREEERLYTWGTEKPRPGHHGHFRLEKSLDPDPRLPSQYEAGTMVVGSYPAGASRDGVMDLAGNVCEWCSDWFQPYEEGDARDPLVQEPSNYRSIRGSSWGYYGHPVEVHDREYNNPKYPGYVYIGLRVVLPEAGWEKVREFE